MKAVKDRLTVKHLGKFKPVTAEQNSFMSSSGNLVGFTHMYKCVNGAVMTFHIYIYAFARCLNPMLHYIQRRHLYRPFPWNQTRAIGLLAPSIFLNVCCNIFYTFPIKFTTYVYNWLAFALILKPFFTFSSHHNSFKLEGFVNEFLGRQSDTASASLLMR